MKDTNNFNVFINGRAGAGKSTIAQYLHTRYEYVELTLASGIYDIAQEYFFMKKKDRQLLQEIGQKMREINPDVWIDYILFIANLYTERKEGDRFVISDVRQENEFNKLKEADYISIKVETDLETRIERIEARDNIKIDAEYIDRIENHQAETGADNKEYDYVINNDGTLEDLYKQIDYIVNNITNK